MKTTVDSLINKLTFLYGLLPITIFFIGWLRPIYSISATSLLAYSGFIYLKRNEKFYKQIKTKFNWVKISLTALLVFFWVYCSGIGGYTNQDWDHHSRNAIFYDLLAYKWPIYYSFPPNYHLIELAGKHTSLNYYFTYWLPAALIGKLFSSRVANAFLLVWTYVGVLLSIYYLNRLFKFKYLLLCTGLFILWGNFDVVSYLLVRKISTTASFLSGTTYFHFYTSFTTDLYNPFNQAVPAWLFTLYVLNYAKKLQVFPVVILLAYSPFAFVGLTIAHGLHYLIALGQSKQKASVRAHDIIQTLWQPYSLGMLVILIVYGLFYQAHSNKVPNTTFWQIYLTNDLVANTYILIGYLTTFFLEAGIYLIGIYFFAKRTYYVYKIWYWLIFMFLLTLPLWVIGINSDLASRASIPFLTVLIVMTLNALLELYESRKKNFQFYTIICILLISFYWSIYSIILNLTFTGKPVLKNAVGSLANPKIDELNDPEHMLSSINNFYSEDPQQFFFYQYLAK